MRRTFILFPCIITISFLIASCGPSVEQQATLIAVSIFSTMTAEAKSIMTSTSLPPTITPTSTYVPTNSLVPTMTLQLNDQEPIPGLVGTWQDPETTDTFVITWHNGMYAVLFVTWKDKYYSITYQNWSGSVLTWSYYDTDLDLTVTYTTTSISGDRLYVDWSYNDGTFGSETLSRIR
jgi:hypothetical protein